MGAAVTVIAKAAAAASRRRRYIFKFGSETIECSYFRGVDENQEQCQILRMNGSSGV